MSEGVDLIASAARGDLGAQRALVRAVSAFGAVEEVGVDEAATLAEPLARLAAAHGDTSDRRELLGILLMRFDAMGRDGFLMRSRAYLHEIEVLAEALVAEGDEAASATWAAVLTALADVGCEEAAARLVTLADQITPNALIVADGMARRAANGESKNA